jgi:transposase
LPKDFPPYTTVQRYFYAWRDNGLWQTINHVLLMHSLLPTRAPNQQFICGVSESPNALWPLTRCGRFKRPLPAIRLF